MKDSTTVLISTQSAGPPNAIVPIAAYPERGICDRNDREVCIRSPNNDNTFHHSASPFCRSRSPREIRAARRFQTLALGLATSQHPDRSGDQRREASYLRVLTDERCEA